jgi:hypothetical protein
MKDAAIGQQGTPWWAAAAPKAGRALSPAREGELEGGANRKARDIQRARSRFPPQAGEEALEPQPAPCGNRATPPASAGHDR